MAGSSHNEVAMWPCRRIVHKFAAAARILDISSLCHPCSAMKFLPGALPVFLFVLLLQLASHRFAAASIWMAAGTVCRMLDARPPALGPEASQWQQVWAVMDSSPEFRRQLFSEVQRRCPAAAQAGRGL